MKNTKRWPSRVKSESTLNPIEIMLYVILPGLLIASMILISVWTGVSFGVRDNADNNTSPQDTKIEFAIAQVKDGINPEVIYDKNTKIMYVVSDNGSLTLLLNSDGSPKKYVLTEE